MTRVISKKLGELLIERHVITKEQLAEALDEQKGSGELIGRTLVRLGHATEEDIVIALTLQYGFPYLPLTNYQIDPDVISIVPVSLARRYRVVPLDQIGNLLTVTMCDPLDTSALSEIESVTGLKVESFVSTESQVSDALDRFYPDEGAEGADGAEGAAQAKTAESKA